MGWAKLCTIEARFANGYCSRVWGKVRGWAKLCTCLMGNVWLIAWRSFANRALFLSVTSFVLRVSINCSSSVAIGYCIIILLLTRAKEREVV